MEQNSCGNHQFYSPALMGCRDPPHTQPDLLPLSLLSQIAVMGLAEALMTEVVIVQQLWGSFEICRSKLDGENMSTGERICLDWSGIVEWGGALLLDMILDRSPEKPNRCTVNQNGSLFLPNYFHAHHFKNKNAKKKKLQQLKL